MRNAPSSTIRMPRTVDDLRRLEYAMIVHAVNTSVSLRAAARKIQMPHATFTWKCYHLGIKVRAGKRMTIENTPAYIMEGQ